jgi:hypothetical protein
MDDLNFRFELSREASGARITVYDLLGQEKFKIERYEVTRGGSDEGLGTSPGWNTMSCGDAEGPLPDLASGVYIYELKVYSSDGVSDRKTGKFAVAR